MKKLIILLLGTILLSFTSINPPVGCDSQKKYENSNFLPTLYLRDTTNMYVQKMIQTEISSKKNLVLYYLGDSIASFILDVQEDTKIINAEGQILEVVIFKKNNNKNAPAGTYEKKTYFYVKGIEIRTIIPNGITNDFFRVKKYSESDYVFCFGDGPDYVYKTFLRQKLVFCQD